MSYVPDNYDAYRQYERDKERDEFYIEKLTSIEQSINEAKFICDDYDTEDNADLCNRLERIREILEKIDL